MMKKPLFALSLVTLLTLTAASSGVGYASARQARQKSQPAQKPAQNKATTTATATRHVCPMHPDVVSAKPGKCPKCGMALRPQAPEAKDSKDAKDAPPAAASSADDAKPETRPDGTLLTAPQIPDVVVYDQDGKRLNFYTDLVKGRTVAVNFIFTTCTTICPPLTATFRRVQQQLADGGAGEVRLISVSVDPVVDTPERLRDYAAKFKAAPGWTFVTGEKLEMDTLLRALGGGVSDKNDHTPSVLVGNDAAGRWTRTYGLSTPSALVKVIKETAAN